MNGTQGTTFTAGTTEATIIVLTDVDFHENKNWFIVVTAGTVKFGTTAVIAASAKGWTVGDVIPPFSCRNGDLYFDAASGADTFVVTCTP